LIEKERFFDTLFQKQMFKNIFEDIIEKVFITFSLMTHRELVSRETFEYVKTVNQKIIKLILDVEDKKFRDFIDNKTNYIANMLMNEQTSVGKKYDFGFGNSIKDSNEFAFIISLKLKQKLKIISEINAIKNAAQIISLTIIDTFMSLFIDSYLKEIQSDDIKTYLENSVNGCLSEELKNKIQTLIEDLKKYQKEESNN
jgi:hypothetical protein